MQCSQCHRDNRDGARFCQECGSPLATLCAICGTKLKAGSKFCDSCGAPLASAEAPPAPPQFTSPDSYTPDHLAKKILSSRAALEGERKQVTVLFADVKGSTDRIADLDPEDARRLLDPVLERMMEAVHRYEGTVNQVMGDGIMALFGAPLACEDHAVRACYSALTMQELMKKYADEVRRTEGLPLQIRVGINSGEVVVRSIGSDLHMNYAAHGLTTHLAARMEQMAIPGTILATSQTCRLAEGYVAVKALGPMPVKGLTEPVEAYELVGANDVRSRLQVAAIRGLTRFVGRLDEMDQLQRAVDRAQAGHGQVIALVGEPGAGKSRLVHEFLHSRLRGDWRILESSAASYGTTSAYLAVTELLKQYFQIATSDEPSAIREKVTSKLLSLGETLLPTLPALLTLLDLPPDEPLLWNSDPSRRRQRTLDAVKRLLFRESEVKPLLLVLEDLHSADLETQVVIDGLVQSLPTARLLLLLTYRPEYRHGWGGKTYYTQVRIDPLAPTVAHEMLDTLIGTDKGLEPLKHLLVEKTEGNPFFIEESVQSLVETGALSGKSGTYLAAKAISDLKIPATIESLLTSRIDHLSPLDKRLLQTVAVVGNPAPLSVLQAMGEFSDEELPQALGGLQAAEILYETKLFPDIEYTCKHALIHQTAYQMLSPDPRRALHLRALIAGEGVYADLADEKADWLGFHAFRAEAWDRAVLHLRAAAARATARAASRVAAEHLERAITAVDRSPSQRRTELAIDLRIELRHALTPLGRVQRTLEHLRAAEPIATELNDYSRLGRIASFTTNCLLLQARYQEAIDTGARAVKIARELRDHRLELATSMFMARARSSRGECQMAIAMFQDIIRTMDEQQLSGFLGLPVLPAVFARSNLATNLAEVGAFAEADAYATEAVRRATTGGQPESITWAYWSTGLVALIQGDSRQAVRVFDRLLHFCGTHDLDAYPSRIMAALGRAKARLGQVDEGLLLLQQAVALDSTAEPQTTHSFALICLSEASFLAGSLEKAMTIATEAVQFSRNHAERSAEAYACWLLALIHNASGGDPELAAGTLQTAAAIANELGLKPLVAHCHLGFGDLHDRQGDRQEAATHRECGQRLLDALGMKPWLNLDGGLASGSRSRSAT